jgi:tetratricopeptide (TPR) repeat protein
MPARILYWLTLVRVATLGFAIGALWFPLWGQQMQPPGVPTADPFSQPEAMRLGFDLDIFVRDSHGNPLDVAAAVHLSSKRLNYDAVLPAQGASAAHFANLALGEYAVEVTCSGFRKTTDRYSSELGRGTLPVYIYLIPESGPANSAASSSALALTQQQRADMQLGIAALNRDRYESAGKTFAKILRKAPGNSDVVYFLGVAELGLKHPEVARENFQRALALDPNNELALVSLGQMKLDGGAPADAVIPLEKAVSLGRAGWRADFELASAYFQLHRLSDAEIAASRAASLAKETGATSLFLLGEIQYAEGKRADAKHTWESLLKRFPKDSAVFTTRKMLARVESEGLEPSPPSSASLPPPPAPDTNPATFVEVPWAPRDTDDAVYAVAPSVNCNAEPILDGALHQMNTQLTDFEKFTATEHIEHQNIDSYGWPGPIKTHDFSYVVFVHPLGKNSFYLEEFRNGAGDLSGFSDVIVSTGLNSLGVNLMQPFYRDRFDYSCEGLANVREQAAWQIRFEEKRDAKAGGVRTWRAGNTTYDIAIKGRIWISGASYAVLRIETDLRDPIAGLGLTKDHLLVDYGPVNFSARNAQLWLPWSADMYMEFRGKRYHHRHFLSDYLLFNVDTAHKISKPNEPLPPPAESDP